ncbi:urea ABC transporter ATP-binding subunit UrtE [Variovorax sp. CCNWLW225]|uniref:Urea ABC transporter ATP-binding subunit UrtE n=1 Tax=Variovorax beijingensis TaxID=2496117 RepID=A0ABX9ZXU2_9BURK|nr:urea ABC transporter ATP-binding subunit UrtE [Variovorax beijingensis]RSZ29228.1 urea ABC transporter ATP-binding subunit UrtE [Variovorax beijingensis]
MLKIEGLNQYYGSSHVLRQVRLQVADGGCTVLLGRNGVGKTTLLRCLMGLLPIRSGQVTLGGQEVASWTPEARAQAGMGYVPQGREVFPELTVRENLLVGEITAERRRRPGRPGDGAGQDRRPRHTYEDVVNLFPVLKSMGRRLAGNLSGGQQQQLAIARALLTQPRLLILDEPTEGIQPSIVQEIQAVIASLKGQLSILLVEQYVDFAESVADRFTVLVRGQVVASGEGRDMAATDIRSLISV